MKIPTSIAAILLALASLPAFGAESYPPTDPPLPRLIEPSQTEDPAVYGARRAAQS